MAEQPAVIAQKVVQFGGAQPGSKTLLEGEPGAGKTHAIKTFLKAGLKVSVIFLEQGQNVLGDTDPEKLSWHYIKAASGSWASMISAAGMINNLANDALQKLNKMDAHENQQYIEMLQTCNKFVDDRTGKDLGDVAKWGTDRVLVIDGLSGLSKMARALAVGYKPILSQPDWGVAMNAVDMVIQKMTNDLFCHFVLISHIEPEKDEVTGSMRNYPSTLGRKLAPTIPRYFNDVILSYRDGSTFLWSTASNSIAVKGQYMPLNDKMLPDFNTLIESWKKKGGQIVEKAP